MFRLILDDPLFSGHPGPDLTGSPDLTDITFAGQRRVMPLQGPVEKTTGPEGISQRGEREMGWFSGSKSPEQLFAEAEKAVNVEQHRAWRAAGNNSRKHFRDENDATNLINAEVIAAEQNVPWWRR